jgi:glycosyltransferase involved in cell wall biosynthesis
LTATIDKASTGGPRITNKGSPVPRVLLTTMRGLDGKGGVERLMKSFYDARAEFADITFVPLTTASEDGPFPVRAAQWAVAWLRFLWGCLANRFDIAHINLAWRGSTWRKIVYIRTAALFGKKTILHLHGSGYDRFYESVSPRRQAAIRSAFARADRIVVLSEYWRRFVVETLGADPDKVVEIANGVAPPARSGPRLPRPAGGAVTILFLGEIGERKGVPTLLEATARPELADLPWKMIIAGNGDLAAYEAEARRLGIAERVTFPGWQDEASVARLLEDADLLVLPSQAENQPISILNAMSAGLPVVASNVGAIPEMIEDRRSGILVPPRDPAALASALRELISDPAERERMGKRGEEIFRARFRLDETIRRFRDLYLAVWNEPAKSGSAPAAR